MEQRITIITIGVDSLPAMRAFYTEKLGWKPVAENKDIVFFKCHNILFSLFGRKPLAEAAGLSAEGSGFRPYNLAYNVHTKEEVREILTALKAKGVHVLREATEFPFGGYAGYFQDIEGNVWEVAYNPFIPLDKEGDPVTHESLEHVK